MGSSNLLVIFFLCGLSVLAVAERSVRQVSGGSREEMYAREGDKVYLPCKLTTSEYSVNWYRGKDMKDAEILSSGYTKNTSDDRIFDLEITTVFTDDSGDYFCMDTSSQETYHVSLHVISPVLLDDFMVTSASSKVTAVVVTVSVIAVLTVVIFTVMGYFGL